MAREILKIMTYVDGKNDTPFPSAEEQIGITEYTYTSKRMGGVTLSATLMYKDCIDKIWTGLQYVTFRGEKYFISATPSSGKDNEDTRYEHTLSFIAERDLKLNNVYFYDAVSDESTGDDKYKSNSTKVVFFGTIQEFVARLNESLKYSGIDYTVVIDEGISSDGKLMSFEDQFFFNVLQEIYNTYEVPFYFVGKVIHIGFTSNAITQKFRYGFDNELLSIKKNNANYRIVNRCTGIGSEDNIPYYYPNATAKGDIYAKAGDGNKGILQSGITITDMNKFAGSVKVGQKITYRKAKYSNLSYYDTYTKQNFVVGQSQIDMLMYYGDIFFRYIHVSADISEPCTFSLNMDFVFNKTSGNGRIGVESSFGLGAITGEETTYCLQGIEEDTADTVFDSDLFLNGKVILAANGHNITIKCRKSGKMSFYIGMSAVLTWASRSAAANAATVSESETKSISRAGVSSGTSDNRATYVCTMEQGLQSDAGGWYIEQPSDSGETKNELVSLSDCGLSVSGTPSDGDYITQAVSQYITPSKNLLPPVYRESLGAERFYNAENDTYTNPETGAKYEFENEFDPMIPREHIQQFEDIKPTIKGMSNASGQRMDQILDIAFDDDDNDDVDEEGNYQHPYFFVKLPKYNGDYGFNLFDHAIDEAEMSISMTSGQCGGCEFVIGVDEDTQKNPVHVNDDGSLKRDENGNVITTGEFQDGQNDTRNNEVWIALKKEKSTYGQTMPNAQQNLKPAVGDTFVILHIDLPAAYILNAENELKEAIIKYMAQNNSEKFNFSITFSRIYLAQHPEIESQLNENARIIVEYDGTEYVLYISQYTYKCLDDEALPEITVEITDTIAVQKTTLQNTADSIKQDMNNAIGNVDFLANGLLYFLRKDVDDYAYGKITFRKGIEIGNYTFGSLGSGGQISVDDNGASHAVFDFLEVRRKAIFKELTIEELSHVGGQIIVSPASMVCSSVEDVGDAYRCRFNTTDDEGIKVFNMFAAGDQARCQTFNQSGNRYYWRLVVATGDDYIDLSKDDCDVESDIPSAGDRIVQFGNRDDMARQSAQIISCYGENAPSYIMYAGINSYSLEDKNITGIIYNWNAKEPQLYSYGSMFFGDRDIDAEDSTFVTFQQKAGDSKKQLYIKGNVSIGPNSSGLGNLSEWSDAEDSINNAQSTANSALQKAQDAKDYIDNTLPGEIAELNAKIDGVVENWFYDYTPARSNEPAATWIADGTEKDHVGDTFTNTQEYVDDETTPDAGKSWRWVESGDSYTWTPIADSDAVKALQQAAKAQDTADEKRRVFIATPYTPYDVGDMWMQGPSGEIMRCIKARQTGSYTASDWDRASKYTDDTAVNNLQVGAVNLIKNSKLSDRTGWSLNGSVVEPVTFNGVQCIKIEECGAGYYTHQNSGNVPLSGQVTNSIDVYAVEGPAAVAVGVEGIGNLEIAVPETGKWVRVHSVQQLDGQQHAYIVYSRSSFPLYIKNVKCEAGNKATSWSHAPDDVDGAINEVGKVASSALDRVTLHDTRNANESPQWYIENYPRQSVQEFKLCSVIGLPAGAGADSYCYVVTDIIWDDSSGGWPRQTAKTNDGKQYWRAGTSSTTWGEWKDAYGTAQDASQNKTVTMIDATGLDAGKYYPVTMKLDDQHRTYIDVSVSLEWSAVPSWATHARGFTCKGRWSAYGNGWGNTKISRIVDVFQFDYTSNNVPPFGTVGQLEYTSEEYVYVRGGGKYEFTVWGGDEPVTPVLRSSNYTSGAGQSLEAGITSVTVPQTVDARISDLDYLKDTFADFLDVDGVVLGKLVAVKDDNGEVQAMLNGSDLGKDNTHGKLLIAGGISDITNPENAKTRIYEDGTIDTEKLVARGGGKIGNFNIVEGIGLTVYDSSSTSTTYSSSYFQLWDDGGGMIIGKEEKKGTAPNSMNRTVKIIATPWGSADIGDGEGSFPSASDRLSTAMGISSIERGTGPGIVENIALLLESKGNAKAERNLAIKCLSGMFAGLRPKIRSAASTPYYLSEFDHTLVSNHDSGIWNIYLPSNPKAGQQYHIIKQGTHKLNLMGNGHSIHRPMIWESTYHHISEADGAEFVLIYDPESEKWWCQYFLLT